MAPPDVLAMGLEEAREALSRNGYREIRVRLARAPGEARDVAAWRVVRVREAGPREVEVVVVRDPGVEGEGIG